MKTLWTSCLLIASALPLWVGCGDDSNEPGAALDDDSGVELPKEPFDRLLDGGIIASDASPIRTDGANARPSAPSSPTNTAVSPAPTAPADPRFQSAPKPPACDGLPTPQTLYKHTMKIYGLGLIGDTLYFAGYQDGIFALPKDGSAAPTVVSKEFARDLATVGNSALVSQALTGIRVTPMQLAAGTEPEDVSLEPEVVAFGDHVYSYPDLPACFGTTNVVHVVDATGESESFSFPCGVQAASGIGDKVFAIVSSDKPTDGIYSATLGKDDEDPVRIVSEKELGGRLGVTPAHLYFTLSADVQNHYLARAPIAGGTAEVLAGPLTPNSFASDGKTLFVNDAKSGCLYTFDESSKALKAVAKVGVVEDIAFDEGFIYLGSFSGAISRLPR